MLTWRFLMTPNTWPKCYNRLRALDQRSTTLPCPFTFASFRVIAKPDRGGGEGEREVEREREIERERERERKKERERERERERGGGGNDGKTVSCHASVNFPRFLHSPSLILLSPLRHVDLAYRNTFARYPTGPM